MSSPGLMIQLSSQTRSADARRRSARRWTRAVSLELWLRKTSNEKSLLISVRPPAECTHDQTQPLIAQEVNYVEPQCKLFSPNCRIDRPKRRHTDFPSSRRRPAPVPAARALAVDVEALVGDHHGV